MSANDAFLTRYYREVKAPGIPKGDRAKRKLREACEAVSRDIEQMGAVSYETAELVRAALACPSLS